MQHDPFAFDLASQRLLGEVEADQVYAHQRRRVLDQLRQARSVGQDRSRGVDRQIDVGSRSLITARP
jgi:hypothetical protein